MSGLSVPPTWAVETNYPAGANPWNSQPCKVAPVGDLWLPGTGDGAENRNYVDNVRCVSLASIQKEAIAGALNRWSAAQTSAGLVGGTTITGAAWDQVNGRWLVVLSGGGANSYLFETLDGGTTWTQVAAGWGSSPSGLAYNAGAGVIVQPGGPGSAVFIDTTDTYHVHSLGINLTVGYPIWYPGMGASGGWQVITGNQSGGSFNTGLVTWSTDGATWSSIASGYPTGWNSDTNHIGAYLAATSGPLVVWALCGATAGTDTSRLMVETWSGTSGGTTGIGTPTFSPLASSILTGRIITGLAYQANTGLWGLLAWSGVNTNFYTTPDLANWTLQSSIGVLCQGLAAVGPLWAMSVPYSLSPDSVGRVQISGDGGVTWSWTPSLLDAVATAGTLVTSSNGLLAASSAKAIISGQVGLL